MEKLIREFKEVIDIHSPAQVAVWLGYRDTRQILQWIALRKIPKARVAKVKDLVMRKGLAQSA